MNVRDSLLAALSAAVVAVTFATPVHAGTPSVPEPATLTLVGAGAAAVGLIAWWRKRK